MSRFVLVYGFDGLLHPEATDQPLPHHVMSFRTIQHAEDLAVKLNEHCGCTARAQEIARQEREAAQ